MRYYVNVLIVHVRLMVSCVDVGVNISYNNEAQSEEIIN